MAQVHPGCRQRRVLVESLKFISRSSWTDSRTFSRLSAAKAGLLSVVVVAVLCFSTASAETIVAYENEKVTLPCRTNQTSDLLTVEWSKAGMTPNITLLYRAGSETVEEKNSAFINRTSLRLEEVKRGDISQVVSGLRLSDEGRYLCRTMVEKQRQDEAVVNLIVGAASEPKLTFVRSGADGGLTVECSAERWFPEPEITFYDGKSNLIEAEDPRTDLDSGRFNVKRRASLRIVTDRVTCRVHQPLLKKTLYANIYIPDACMRSCTYSMVSMVWSGVGTAVLLALCAAAYFLWKKCGRSYCRQKSPKPLQLLSPSTENAINTQLQEQIKGLQAQIKDLPGLKSHISEKDQIIAKQKAELEELQSKLRAAQQQNQPTANSSSSLDASHQVTQTLDTSNTPPAATSASHNPKSGNVSKAKDPKPAGSGQVPAPPKKDRPKSTSDLLLFVSTNKSSTLPGFSSASASKDNKPSRSMSFSGSHAGVSRSSRRYTVVGNPFSVLADLTEESEALIH